MQTIEQLRYLAKFKGDQETLGSVPATLLADAADEIERLRAALARYGDHVFGCGSRSVNGFECNCGFEALNSRKGT